MSDTAASRRRRALRIEDTGLQRGAFVGVRITHAQPLVPDEEGRLFARPLLSETEAELEVLSLMWGDDDVVWEFGELDGVELGLYTHRIRLFSGPPHLCRDYLIRLAG